MKDLWSADLTPGTVSMKGGSPISHVTCCTIRSKLAVAISTAETNCANDANVGGPENAGRP